jgi:hypothetical protein
LASVNTQLSSDEVERCLFALERALLLIRAACWAKDPERAAALADAFHNLPCLLVE